MGKYTPLGDHLQALPADVATADLNFEQVSQLVGGLPASAYTLRNWWANNSHGQALAWREAGWHVESVVVHPERGRVTFARGRVGGSMRDRRTPR